MNKSAQTPDISSQPTPRYLLTRLSLALLRACTHLPFTWQIHLGKGLGTLMYFSMSRRRHIAEVNLRLCFPNQDHAARSQLVRKAFHSAGISLFETALCWWGSDKQLAPLCEIHGLEHLRAALKAGKGVILLSAHFTCLEIGGRLLSLHHPFAVMYKRHRNPVFETVMKQARETQFERAIPQEDIRLMLRTLKENLAVWYAPDQDLGRIRSVFAPFMGVPAATLTAPARLTKMSGAKVVPFFPLRKPDNSGYVLTILPALKDFPVEDDSIDCEVANATRINAIIEQQILKAPEQYLWLHRRFKSRPGDEPSFYES